MRKLNGRELKALFVLSIVAPVSILVSLRLSGVLREPVIISETIILEAVKWEFQRLNQSVDILDKLNTTYTSDGLSANMYVLVVSYHNNSIFSDDNDFLRIIMMINSTSTNPNSFIESLHVIFHRDVQPSLVDWLGTSLNFDNLSLTGAASGWTSGEDYGEAYVMLTGLNYTNSIHFQATVEWSLLTLNNQTHQLEVACELIYYNGTAYKKIVQPFQLKIVGR